MITTTTKEFFPNSKVTKVEIENEVILLGSVFTEKSLVSYNNIYKENFQTNITSSKNNNMNSSFLDMSNNSNKNNIANHWLFSDIISSLSLNINKTDKSDVNKEERELISWLISAKYIVITNFYDMICWPYIISKYGAYDSSNNRISFKFIFQDLQNTNNNEENYRDTIIEKENVVRFLTTEPIAQLSRFYLNEFYSVLNKNMNLNINNFFLYNNLNKKLSESKNNDKINVVSPEVISLLIDTIESCNYLKHINLSNSLSIKFLSSNYSLGSFNILAKYYNKNIFIIAETSILTQRYCKELQLPINSRNSNINSESALSIIANSEFIDLCIILENSTNKHYVIKEQSNNNNNGNNKLSSYEIYFNSISSVINKINNIGSELVDQNKLDIKILKKQEQEKASRNELEINSISTSSPFSLISTYPHNIIYCSLLTILDLIDFLRLKLNNNTRIFYMHKWIKHLFEYSNISQGFINVNLHNKIYDFVSSFEFYELMGIPSVGNSELYLAENSLNNKDKLGSAKSYGGFSSFTNTHNALTYTPNQRLFICSSVEDRSSAMLGKKESPSVYFINSFFSEFDNDLGKKIKEKLNSMKLERFVFSEMEFNEDSNANKTNKNTTNTTWILDNQSDEYDDERYKYDFDCRVTEKELIESIVNVIKPDKLVILGSCFAENIKLVDSDVKVYNSDNNRISSDDKVKIELLDLYYTKGIIEVSENKDESKNDSDRNCVVFEKETNMFSFNIESSLLNEKIGVVDLNNTDINSSLEALLEKFLNINNFSVTEFYKKDCKINISVINNTSNCVSEVIIDIKDGEGVSDSKCSDEGNNSIVEVISNNIEDSEFLNQVLSCIL